MVDEESRSLANFVCCIRRSSQINRPSSYTSILMCAITASPACRTSEYVNCEHANIICSPVAHHLSLTRSLTRSNHYYYVLLLCTTMCLCLCFMRDVCSVENADGENNNYNNRIEKKLHRSIDNVKSTIKGQRLLNFHFKEELTSE